MTFRLTTIFWVFALVAAGLSLLGAWGLIAAVGVLLLWMAIFQCRAMRWRILTASIGLLMLNVVVFISPIMIALQASGQSSASRDCREKMTMLVHAIWDYHSANGSLPPPTVIRGKIGDLHSWRIEILPFADKQALYQSYRFDEPWNGPNNGKLVFSPWSTCFGCPTHGEIDEANYVAIVGPQTAWGDGEPRKLSDIPDGAGQTILFIEVAGRGIDWREPRDLSFDEAVDLLSSPISPLASDGHVWDTGLFYKPHRVRNVATCNSGAIRIRQPIPRQTAIALLTVSGGEEIDFSEIVNYGGPELDYRAIYAFAMFVLISLLPGILLARRSIGPKASARERARLSRRATPRRTDET